MLPWPLVISALILPVWGKFSFSGSNGCSSLACKKSFMAPIDLGTTLYPTSSNSFHEMVKSLNPKFLYLKIEKRLLLSSI